MGEGVPNDNAGGDGDEDHTQYYGDVNCLYAVGHCPPKSKKCQRGLPLVGWRPSATANPTTLSEVQGAGARTMIKISLQAQGPVVHTYRLVDTGNKLPEGVAMNEDLARKLQLPIVPCNITVGTATNGGGMRVIGRVHDIDVTLGGTCPAYIKTAMVIPKLRTPINLGSKWIEWVKGMVDYSTPNEAALVVRRMRVPLV